jgi:hypothetical protein
MQQAAICVGRKMVASNNTMFYRGFVIIPLRWIILIVLIFDWMDLIIRPSNSLIVVPTTILLKQHLKQYPIQEPLKMLHDDNNEDTTIIPRHFVDETSKILTRRTWIQYGVVTSCTIVVSWSSNVKASYVETIGKDSNCNDANCLGIWDGLFANCNHVSSSSGSSSSSSLSTTIQGMIRTSAGCVSSQDDTPGSFAEPWDYSEDTNIDTTLISNNESNNNDEYVVKFIMKRLINAIQTISQQRGDQVGYCITRWSIFTCINYRSILW